MRLKHWYEARILPHLIDRACGLGQVMKQRRLLIPQAQGRVLEVGLGTGLNLSFYDPSRVTELVGLDPALALSPQAVNRAALLPFPVTLVALSAEGIDAPDASFDTVVCTFTLCTIPDAHQALMEMRRVLKPQGQLLFCEHGLAPDGAVQRWQRAITPLWKPCAGGCHLDRAVQTLLTAGGFRVVQADAQYLSGPRPWTYVTRGVAVPA